MSYSRQRLVLRYLVPAVLAGGLMALFQVAKHVLDPNMTMSRSHQATILFTAIIALVIAAADLRGQRRRRRSREMPAVAQDAGEQTLGGYELLAGFSRDIILFLQLDDGRITEANLAATLAYGYSREELLALTIYDLQAAETRAATAQQMAEVAARGLLFETVHRRKDGSTFPVEMNSQGVSIGGACILISLVRDISDRTRAEIELRRLNRALSALSKCNEALIHATNEADLLTEICEIVVHTGGYRMAWVTFREGSQQVRAAAKAGFDEGYLENLNLTWAEAERGIGWIGAATRTGAPCVVRDIAGSPQMARWQEAALQRGYSSSIVLPLLRGARAFGALTIYASEKNAFDHQEVELLNELACDLAYGITALQNAAARERAEAVQAHLAAIVECSNDAISGLSPEGIITSWNDAAARLYGYTAEEVIGKHVRMLFPPGHPKKSSNLRERIAAGERVPPFESVRRRKDGSVFDALVSTSPILGEGGKMIGTATVTHDITGRKNMEKALLRSEERFKLAVRATNDLIWDWDLSSGTFWRSETYWKHFGYPPPESEPGGDEWLERLHPDDRERVRHALQDALAQRMESFGEIECRYRRADGSYATCLNRASVLYEEAGRPVRAVGAIRDVTERLQMQEQLRQAQKLEAVGRLTGGVAHDFNNLLMIISSYAKMLQEDLPPEDQLRKNTQEIIKAAARAAALIQQLLAFSRKQVLAPRVMGLNSVVSDTARMVKRLIGEDVELSVALEQTFWAIKVDPDQITQVLLNLCANARDAMPEGGKLTLETRNIVVDAEMASRHPSFLPGCYCSLAVSDTGHGMTKEVQERIFEPFFTTKERGKGTGLGLSTVYGIVKQSGGYVWVYSEPGHGSCFKLYFPRVDQPLTAVAPATSAREGCGETILVVEDEDALRQAVCHHLAALGYVVLQAASGQQALEAANRHPGTLDLLLTDVIMPKMSGPELARQLKRRQPIVVLYMSGYTDEAIGHRGALDPGVTLIHKPFSMDTLAIKLRELLDEQGRAAAVVAN